MLNLKNDCGSASGNPYLNFVSRSQMNHFIAGQSLVDTVTDAVIQTFFLKILQWGRLSELSNKVIQDNLVLL